MPPPIATTRVCVFISNLLLGVISDNLPCEPVVNPLAVASNFLNDPFRFLDQTMRSCICNHFAPQFQLIEERGMMTERARRPARFRQMWETALTKTTGPDA